MGDPEKDGNSGDPECSVKIHDFHCGSYTCECAGDPDIRYPVSENYLVRFDARTRGGNPDIQKINFVCSRECDGRILAIRGNTRIVDRSVACSTTPTCHEVLDVAQIPRRPIIMEDGSGAMTIAEAITRLQGWGAPTNPIPRVMPFTDRERLRVTVTCCNDEECSDSIDVIGWDCDLILLAYQMNFLIGMTTESILAGAMSVHQFYASMAIRGANALCELYERSAVSCKRDFGDINAAVGLSAVLAEETLKAHVDNLRQLPVSDGWREFFDLGNPLMGQLDLASFQDFSEKYGQAHLREGMVKALQLTGRSECRAADLNRVVDTLADAQEATLNQAVGAITTGMLGTSAKREFKRSMREKMLDALREAGENTAAHQLDGMWASGQ